MRRAILTVPVLLATVVLGIGGPASAVTTAPAHMAALGDSITRAFDVSGSYFLRDAPAESWSTGTDTRVNSEYLRLRARSSTIVAENDAVTGAKMATLQTQMATALSHGSDYITVLMGANDVCSSPITSTTSFRADFEKAMQQTQGKSVKVFVSSIPDVNRLYALFATNGSAKFAWSIYKVCQTVLPPGGNDASRQAVATQLAADNTVLHDVCALYTTCTYDNGATNAVTFLTSDVSTVDYFHPSISGQAKLAGVAWAANPYGP